jgi:CheY-like chemotaxis protein
MPCTTAGRILVAGHTSASTSFTLKQLEREGCAVQSVGTIAEAESSLRAARFDIVLASEILSDGRGYDLTDSVVNRSSTLLVAITLSEACLWLPVVQHGVRTLGDRALNAHTLQSEMTALLNEKAALVEHLAAPSLYAFMPQSVAHRFMAGLDQRTGPEERRGLVFKGAPEAKKLPRARAGDRASRPAADGSTPLKDGTEKLPAAAHGAIPERNFR